MRDGREFNFSYLKAIDIVSLIRDEGVQLYRLTFQCASGDRRSKFYRIPRVKFWNFVKEQKELQDYVGTIIVINCLKAWSLSSI